MELSVSCILLLKSTLSALVNSIFQMLNRKLLQLASPLFYLMLLRKVTARRIKVSGIVCGNIPFLIMLENTGAIMHVGILNKLSKTWQ